jgi:hypothetical protein
MMFVFTANWTGQEDSVRVVVEAPTKEEAAEIARQFYPGFHYIQCFEVYDLIMLRHM